MVQKRVSLYTTVSTRSNSTHFRGLEEMTTQLLGFEVVTSSPLNAMYYQEPFFSWCGSYPFAGDAVWISVFLAERVVYSSVLYKRLSLSLSLSIYIYIYIIIIIIIANPLQVWQEFKKWSVIYCLLLYCHSKIHEWFYFLFVKPLLYTICALNAKTNTVISSNRWTWSRETNTIGLY